MFYLVLGLVVAVAVGALLKQKQKSTASGTNPDSPEPATEPTPEGEQNANPVLAAKPISSPKAVATATYSTAAPAAEGSQPYAFSSSSDEKSKGGKASATLLRWCSRSHAIQVGNFVVQSPVTYWSNGPSSTEEPSCIDITLPVEFPEEGTELPSEGAVSYKEMSPLQRGMYLTWLAGGRIQPPYHICYPTIWLYGLERRAMIDRLDLGLCIAEAFCMLPLIRWEAMRNTFIRFITWMAVKIWLPEEELLALCKRLLTVPDELLGMLLGSYANSVLPVPAAVAFTLMRTSARLREAALGPNAPQIAHSDALLQQFTTLYRTACSGGLILEKPKNSLAIAYTPTNPTLARSQKDSGPVEIPNFFEDLKVFQRLFNAWKEFVANLTPRQETAAEALEERPDFEAFIAGLRPEGSDAPLLSDLGALGDLMKLDRSEEKVHGRIRKDMVDMAQVEGYQILPDLGISGRDYRWEDKILFLPLELGTALSQDYCTAAFLLEFLCSLTGARGQRVFQPMRQRLSDYFTLSTEDHIRLEAQQWIHLPAPYPPEFYGEFIQIWLQEEDRSTLRDFLIDFLSLFPDAQARADSLRTAICAALHLPDTPSAPQEKETASAGEELTPEEASPEKKNEPTPRERGEKILKILEPLFGRR
ncbi:MAG: TerB N-terminal domain-containing protein [Fretibacterium sp.]|nr:TerB N-terminal domain-containing protein [Fretibacterium sp.]